MSMQWLMVGTCVGLLSAGAGAEPPIFPEASTRVSTDAETMIKIDANGDGACDVVLTGIDQNLEVWLGGEETFTRGNTYELIARVTHGISGDVNNDGHDDLVLIMRNLGRVEIWAGDGTGRFERQLPSITIGPDPSSIALADMDGDGDQDFVIGNATNPATLDIRFNDGMGQAIGGVFGITLEGIIGPSIATLDWDRDGDIDVASGSASDPRIRLMENDGTGNVTSFDLLTFNAGDAYDLAAADINGDGEMDLVAGDRLNTAILLARNGGDGKSWINTRHSISSADAGPISTGDLNLDGYDDIVIGSSSNGSMGIFYGTPVGVQPTVRAGEDAFSSTPEIGDFDGDGLPDICVLNGAYDTLTVIRGQGSDPLLEVMPFDTDERSHAYTIKTADLDNDQIDEMVVAMGSGGYLISEIDRDGSLLISDQPPTFGIIDLEAGDIDLDGDLDLVFTDTGSGGRVGWVFNEGDGTMGGASYRSIGGLPRGLALADLDGDSDLDVLTAKPVQEQIASLENLGNGLFGKAENFPGLDSNTALHLIDVNNDGRDDIVTTTIHPDSGVGVHLALPGGGYAPPQYWETGLLPGGEYGEGLVPADIDGDGTLDLVVPCDDSMSVLLNDGKGGFPTLLRLAPFLSFTGADVADFDEDGDLDIVGVHGEDRLVVLFLRRPTGIAFDIRYFAVDGQPRVVRAMDVNRDTTPDLVVGGETAVLSVLINQRGVPCPGDLSPPFGEFNFDDILAFLGAFAESDDIADLAPPFGSLDFDDVLAFLTSFASGCP